MNENKMRMNTRGLPKGMSIHQVRAAKKIKKAVARMGSAEENTIGLIRIENAERTLETLKHFRENRPRRPRRMARRVCKFRDRTREYQYHRPRPLIETSNVKIEQPKPPTVAQRALKALRRLRAYLTPWRQKKATVKP